MSNPSVPADAPPTARWPRTRRLARGLAVTVGLASFTALVFALALAVTMPASVLASLVSLPPQVETLSGSVWRGRAGLVGGHALGWEVSFRDLWRARLVADAEVEGPDTRLAGVLTASPRSFSAFDWAGRAGPGLLALAPRLAVTCTPRAVVAVDRLALWRRAAAAEGEVAVAEGTCAVEGGGEVAVPAMTLRLSTERRDASAVLVRDDAAATRLASVTVTGDRRLLVRVEPEGAALIPGMPSSAPLILERPL